MNRPMPFSIAVGPDHSARSSEIPAVTPTLRASRHWVSTCDHQVEFLPLCFHIVSDYFSYNSFPFSFRMIRIAPRVLLLSPRNAQCSRAFSPYRHSFHQFTSSFALKENSTALFSAKCKLFCQNTGGGVPSQTCLATCAPKRPNSNLSVVLA